MDELPPQPPDAQVEAEAHEEHHLRQHKLDKLRALQDAGRDPFRHVRWDRNHCASGIESTFAQLEKEGIIVSIAGRIMSRREHGKAGFADLQDESSRIQLYFKKDILGDDSFAAFKELDLGDIVGVRGKVFKTRTEQITVEVQEWELLSKILQALPEKWHGLQDVEQRFRQRYADMIVNRDAFQRIRKRSKAVAEIRRFLDERGFLEVETPLLHSICGGATAEPFVTHWNALKADYYLRIAIELHLKRLIVGGLERVYEIGRVFRNEGLSTRHNPEFTMLELYWAYTDYTDIMQLTEDLVVHLATNVFKQTEVEYAGHKISFKAPWRRMTFDAALREYCQCGLADLKTLDDVKRQAARLGVPLPKDGGYEKSLDEIWKERVEPHLVQPTFIHDYPVGLSPLAKRIPVEELRKAGYAEDLELAYRFEPFVACMEIGNAFSELNDPGEQEGRLQEQIADHLGRELYDKCAEEIALQKGKKGLHQSQFLKEAIGGYNQVSKLLHNQVDPPNVSMEDVARASDAVRMARAMNALGYTHPLTLFILGDSEEMWRQCWIHKGIWSHLQFDRLQETIEGTRTWLAIKVDEDFITALEYAMPPTGGLGIGIDRLIMILSGTPSIREVIAFPQLRQK